MYKIALGIITQTLGKIIDIHVIVGKVVCQMNFLVVNINNYDLLLGLDFLTKIRMVVDVEKGVIHVWNRPNVLVEVLPFNVVNALQRIIRLEEAKDAKMREDFSRMNLE